MKVANAFKIENEDIQVEYEILVTPDDGKKISAERKEINESIQEIDKIIDEYDEEIAKLDKEIDRLTNHADGLDYAIAVASGVITGMIDSFFVGELGLFNNASDKAKSQFHKAKGKSNEIVNKFIEKYAKMRGYKPEAGSDRLKGAISFLEEKFPVAQDNTWSGQGISSTHTHHLDDLAHHPTLMGLLSSILVQFFRVSIFASKDGKLHPRIVDTSMKDLKCWIPVVISGVLKWVGYMAEKKNVIGDDSELPIPVQWIVKNAYKLPIIMQIVKVADNWFGHLVSDMGGSKNTAGGGMGIPGIFISLLKEISMLPGIKNTGLPKLVNDLYSSKKYTTDKVDLRTEIAVVKEQVLPIIINEIIVRTFYLIRHFIMEYKEKSFSEINWQNVIPFGNRTITRMLTIATGTFTAVDMADAIIRSGGINPKCLLRINFVGIGRFVIAVGTDVGMGIKRNKLVNKRIAIMGKELGYMNAKVFYKISGLQLDMQEMLESEENLWIEAENAEKALMESYEVAKCSVTRIKKEFEIIGQSIDEIASYREGIERHNPQLIREISDKLRY